MNYFMSTIVLITFILVQETFCYKKQEFPKEKKGNFTMEQEEVIVQNLFDIEDEIGEIITLSTLGDMDIQTMQYFIYFYYEQWLEANSEEERVQIEQLLQNVISQGTSQFNITTQRSPNSHCQTCYNTRTLSGFYPNMYKYDPILGVRTIYSLSMPPKVGLSLQGIKLSSDIQIFIDITEEDGSYVPYANFTCKGSINVSYLKFNRFVTFNVNSFKLSEITYKQEQTQDGTVDEKQGSLFLEAFFQKIKYGINSYLYKNYLVIVS
ncbi:hypothetical protein PPERSA_02213 [Pseudocohnilembus persalinus]|uniref:Transmembrane protein n=1 Tax=Pseudocohnilembus persalinus TaxID=266149 RepID=A0A0V0Q7P8_PSEPJ|nr:hypothetical protein PPERSA_02213 [Pseudocohnilembus persalinus]|eukprot:KRW98269.1 hypothetical protein PPERSA_02213 [Pseudocohnilembus persalinus]